MMADSRRDHPLFGLASPTALDAGLELFDDGILCLDAAGSVILANSAACQILGLNPDAVGTTSASALLPEVSAWQEFAAGRAGGRADAVLRGRSGHQILATARRIPGPVAVDLITLRDMDTIQFRNQRASGGASSRSVRFLSANRTRPDFPTQRRLCPNLHRLLSRGERAIREGLRILITGESGVGKSEVARFLHAGVANAADPFIVMNCASSSDARFEETLFGCESGPDAAPRRGLLEQAEGGTLFLDEVAELPPGAQARLLGFLEDGQAMRVGDGQGRLANVRVIAATNRDLRQLVREGRFRADLYFRLAVIVLTVPPLRDMPVLVRHLAERFLQTFNQRRSTPMILPARYLDLLEDYSFPGNIRELLNIVQRAAIFVDDAESIEAIFADLLSPVDIPGSSGENSMPAGAMFDLKTELRRYEAGLIDKAIRIHGSKRKAAKALGVNIGTIVRKTAEPSEATTIRRNSNQRGIQT